MQASIVVSLFVVVILVGLAIVFFGNREAIPLQDKKMIVVLPFENLGNQEDESLANGLALAIMARLAGIPGLGVIDQSSAIQYKNTTKSNQEIAGELGVDVILKGTVRWQISSGGSSRIRVTPQLINVSDATQLWADELEYEINDIFQVESDIARQVVEALGIVLLEPERLALEEKPTENNEAYQAYLRGLDYFFYPDYSEANVRMRVLMFERAVEIDSDFALAYTMLSRSHSMMYHERYDRTEKRLAMAKEAVDRAFQLNPDLTEVHIALGYYYYHGKKEYDSALEQFTIAIKNEPQNSDTLLAIGVVQRRQGRFELSLDNLKKAFMKSPRNAQMASVMADTLRFMRRYEEAEQYYNNSIFLIPDQNGSYLGKWYNYILWKGDINKARETLEQIPQKNTSLSIYHFVLQELYERDYAAMLELISSAPEDFFEDGENLFVSKAQLAGQAYDLMKKPKLALASYESALTLLEKITREHAEDPRIHSSMGIVYAGLGQKEEAIREGKLGVDLNPVSKDSFAGPHRVTDLARIYIMVDEYDAALDQLEYLLSISSKVSAPMLRIDPKWDPLRDHLRFNRLLEKYSKNN